MVPVQRPDRDCTVHRDSPHLHLRPERSTLGFNSYLTGDYFEPWFPSFHALPLLRLPARLHLPLPLLLLLRILLPLQKLLHNPASSFPV